MKTNSAQAAVHVERAARLTLLPAPADRMPEAESLGERIQRLVAEAQGQALLPMALYTLSPAHPASELLLNLMAPGHALDPSIRQ